MDFNNSSDSSITMRLDDFNFKDILLAWRKRTHEVLQQMNTFQEGFNLVIEDSEVIREVDNNVNSIHKLTENSESDFKKYETLIVECRRLEEETNSLSEQIKCLETTLEELTEEENKSRKGYKKQNGAFDKTISTYSKNLDLNITTKNSSDTTYKALIRFTSQKSMAPIKVIIDKNLRKIIKFDTSEVLTQEMETELKEKFGDLSNNIPQLLCRIREYILKFS